MKKAWLGNSLLVQCSSIACDEFETETSELYHSIGQSLIDVTNHSRMNADSVQVVLQILGSLTP